MGALWRRWNRPPPSPAILGPLSRACSLHCGWFNGAGPLAQHADGLSVNSHGRDLKRHKIALWTSTAVVLRKKKGRLAMLLLMLVLAQLLQLTQVMNPPVTSRASLSGNLPPLTCPGAVHSFFADAWWTTCQCNGGSSPLYACPAGDSTCAIFPNVKMAAIPNFVRADDPHFHKYVATAVAQSKLRPVLRIEGIDRPIGSNVSDDIGSAALRETCARAPAAALPCNATIHTGCFSGIWWDNQVEHLHSDLAVPFFEAFASAGAKLDEIFEDSEESFYSPAISLAESPACASTKWDIIEADPRWPAILIELQARGFQLVPGSAGTNCNINAQKILNFLLKMQRSGRISLENDVLY